MKVTAEIDVMPKEYFKHLCDITIKDIKKSTNKEVFKRFVRWISL